MSDNYISGNTGSVAIGVDVFSFSKWRCNMKVSLPKITNFTSGGFQAVLPAIYADTVTLVGPYNATNMPFTVGNQYTFLLNFTGLIGLTVPAVIESIEPDDDVEGVPIITITAQSNGECSIAIV